jgi:hypothetical protein
MFLTPEKADAMRSALAFLRAVRNQNYPDAGYLCRAMVYGDDKNDPLGNVAASLATMATLLCNELDITDEWIDVRLATINYLEAQGGAGGCV